MTRNLGTTDRALRLVVGLALILLASFTTVAAGSAWVWWAMIVVGAVLAVTGAVGVCPAYAALGLRTRKGA